MRSTSGSTGPARSPSMRRSAGGDVKDFVPLATRVALEASEHYGLLLTSDRTRPRRLDAIGRLVDALDGFLRRHQGEDSYRNQVQWLSG